MPPDTLYWRGRPAHLLSRDEIEEAADYLISRMIACQSPNLWHWWVDTLEAVLSVQPRADDGSHLKAGMSPLARSWGALSSAVRQTSEANDGCHLDAGIPTIGAA